MLKLLVPNAEVADSVLRVDWCVGPEELEIIQREKILNPHVLLVVGQKYVDYHTRDGEAIEKHFEKSRYLVPMEAGTKFIEFQAPGKYEIHASIVGEAGLTVKQLRKRYFGSWETLGILRETGDFQPFKPFLGKTKIEVNVGAEFFTPKPADWEEKWVNLWFDSKAKNPCQFRKRRILAYSVQPLLVGLRLIATTVLRSLIIAILTVGGYRNIGYACVLHPWRDSWNESHDRCIFGNSIFLTNRSGYPRDEDIEAWRIIFYPWLHIAIAAWTYAILAAWPEWGYSWLQGMGLAYAGLTAIVLALIVLGFVATLIAGGIAKLLGYAKAEIRKTPQLTPSEQEQLLLAERKKLEYLQCSTRAEQAVQGKLPIQRYTLQLRFAELKSKICKPYAQ